jgi:acetyl-CoA C-acetyltransferase
MNEAVIVATARTPIGKAARGIFNDTGGVDLVAPLLPVVMGKAGVDASEVEEIVMGCGYPEGATGGNIARASALRAGIPQSSAGAVVSRFCASGLDAVAYAARRIALDGVPVAIAGGAESISLAASNPNRNRLRNAWLEEHVPGIYTTMIETADNRRGALRHQRARRRTSISLESQRRTAAAQQRANSSTMRSCR